MSNIASGVMTITPEIALEMLKANTRNRPMNKQQVVRYAEQMTNGAWELNGEPIIFAEGGVLLDGQHRLAAIVKSQSTLDVLVVRGVDPKTFTTIDTGKLRTKSDVFALEGIKSYTSVSCGVGSYLKISHGYSNLEVSQNKTSITNGIVLDEYYKYEDLYNRINKFSATCYRKIKLMTQSLLFGYCAFLILDKQHSEERVFSFFKQLYGIEHTENLSIEYLRDKLLQNISGQYKMTQSLQKALLVKCWNDYIKGVEHKRLSWSSNEPMPEFI